MLYAITKLKFKQWVLIIALFPSTVLGASESELEIMKEQMKAMQKELAELRALVKKQDRQVASKADVEAVKKKVDKITDVKNEWRDAESVVHLAGYGSIGYTDQERSDSAFNTLKFNPIFHYQYKDLFMLEAELEIELESNGTTKTSLEYGAIDWFINDYMVLQTGKFLSPIGQFRQNIHPDWINKMASAPPGFGHDGAAPLADVGIQLRGGFLAGNPMKINYAAFVGNGPELEEDDGEVHGVDSDGFTRDADGDKVWGGRIGFLPIPKFEIGISAATGNAKVTKMEDGTAVVGDPIRDYDAFGADIAFQHGNLDLRTEYVKQEVGSTSGGVAPDSVEFSSWYAQAAYKIMPSKWETTIRYTDFNSPHSSQYQEQWSLGLNYLFASNAIAKFNYEFNDGATGQSTNDDRLLLQMSYGF